MKFVKIMSLIFLIGSSGCAMTTRPQMTNECVLFKPMYLSEQTVQEVTQRAIEAQKKLKQKIVLTEKDKDAISDVKQLSDHNEIYVKECGKTYK